ncbi:MAG: CRISPR-associated endonuclease Cas2 [Candidatus Eisenbacteria bacterium]|nr:CRISPR-associated endonuclease Cas2 [Candidatus Eisenbacteria bacterium]
MMFLVVYDVGDSSIRARIAKLLEGYGRRVQESVFECALTRQAHAELAGRLKSELKDPENGNVRIYRICADCLAASVGMGRLPDDPGREGFMIY